MREIDASASDVVVYGIVSAPLSLSASRWRGTVHDVSFQELTDYMKRAMRLSSTIEVLIRSMVAEGTEESVLALHTEVMTSAMVILAREIDESGSNAVVCGMFPPDDVPSDKLWSAMF